MAKDLAFEKDLTGDPQKSIRSGFLWIGIASTVSQILSAVSMFVLMIFLTQEELGTATIAVSFGVIMEAFNSLGTNQAFLQSKEITHDEVHSLFWFNTAFGIAIFLVAAPLALPVSIFYENEALIPLFIVAMCKMPLVCTASIPFQLINRRFEYHKISAIKTVTSIFCALLKIVLAALGCGVWSLVIGETAYGIGTLTGGFLFSRYRPALHFRFAECRRFFPYGIKYCLSSGIDRLNKNLHYLIVGKLLGEGTLGIYRIVYELAMTPALALYDVVGQSSFPVFARLQDKREELSRLFLWNQKNVAIFCAIPIVAILFAAEDVFSLMEDTKWLTAVPVIPFALLLSFFRAILQAYPELYRACGYPEYPIGTGVAETALFAGLGSAAILLFPDFGLEAMLVAWTVILVAFLFVNCHISRLMIDISMPRILKALRHGMGFILFASLLSIPAWIWRDMLPWPNWTHIAIEFFILLICLSLYCRFVLGVSIRGLFKRKHEE